MRLIAAFLALVAAAATTPPPHATIEDAQRAAADNDYAHARDLYAHAIDDLSDPRQRDLALITLANIHWRVFHDGAAARAALDRVPAASSEIGQAIVERARIAAELDQDYPAARSIAGRATGPEIRANTRVHAIIVAATAATEPLIRDRLAGRCTDAAAARSAENELHALIADRGPFIDATRALLDAALLSGDGPAALEAWRLYYGVAPGAAVPNQLTAAAETLGRILPSWHEEDRRMLGLALAQSRFFREAVLVLSDPCAQKPLPHDDEVGAILAYENTLRRVEQIADEHYRSLASGHDETPAFHKALDAEGRALWSHLGHTEPYSQEALTSDLSRRFGTRVTLGVTNGVADIHLGHTVSDDDLDVEQYGRRATLRVVLVDGLVSNGFLTWALDGAGGDGGTATDKAIYQFRPMYADGPLAEWLSVSDPAVRAERDQKIAVETQRDKKRSVSDPNGPLPGLSMRLRRESDDDALRQLRAQGLEGAALREAFMTRVRADTWASSIVAHEGRHAIDKKHFGIHGAADLEYRAKLSEVALAPSPRRAASGLFVALSANSPHGVADRRIAAGLAAWMKKQFAEIANLDPAAPLLLQVDKLTDEQLRAAFRSLDPLAQAAPPALRSRN